MGAAVVAVLAVAAVAMLWQRPVPLVMGAVTQVTRSTDTLNFDAAISPDGKFVAYAAGPVGSMRLFVRQVSGSAPVLIATGLTGDHRWPRWSPDGSGLAFVANDALHVIPVLGGAPQLVTTLGDIGGQPSWSPDGTRLACSDSGGISVVAVSGGSPRRVIHTLEAHSPTWSPDGRRIGYAVENRVFARSVGYGNAAPSSIWTASAAGGDSALVAEAASLNTAPVWWPDGRSILFVSDRDRPRDVYRQAMSGNGRPRGAPARVTSGLNVFSFTLSHDGAQMAHSTLQLRSNIWMAPILATGTTPSSAAPPVTTEKQSIWESRSRMTANGWRTIPTATATWISSRSRSPAPALREIRWRSPPIPRPTTNPGGRPGMMNWCSTRADSGPATCSPCTPTGGARLGSPICLATSTILTGRRRGSGSSSAPRSRTAGMFS